MAEPAPFAGKSVVITGASSGLGEALALALAHRGARLSLAARNREALDALAARCRDLGGRAAPFPVDVTDEAQCAALIEQALATYGALDVLVVNAGVDMMARLDTVTDPGLLERVLAVNFFGAVYPAHYALAALRQSHGLIVVMSSVAGLTGVPTRTGYAASKHALIGYFESLRIELMPDGVDVLIAALDYVATGLHQRALREDGRTYGDTHNLDYTRIMQTDSATDILVSAMAARKRMALSSLRSIAGRYVRPLLPTLVDWMTNRAIEKGV